MQKPIDEVIHTPSHWTLVVVNRLHKRELPVAPFYLLHRVLLTSNTFHYFHPAYAWICGFYLHIHHMILLPHKIWTQMLSGRSMPPWGVWEGLFGFVILDYTCAKSRWLASLLLKCMVYHLLSFARRWDMDHYVSCSYSNTPVSYFPFTLSLKLILPPTSCIWLSITIVAHLVLT